MTTTMTPAIHLKLDTGIELPDEAPLQIGVSVWLPADPASASALLVCLPGGNMNRRYFDLRPDDSDDSYSFAAQMTQRGYLVASLDHLGLGDSSKPADGWLLTPERLVQANAQVTATLLNRVREGRLADGMPALPALPSIGVGHSMGAMLTVLQQHAARQHSAIVLLGFSTRGLPEYLPPALQAITDAVAVRPQLVEHARAMFGKPYPRIQTTGNGGGRELFGTAKVESRGVVALKDAADTLLPVPAMMSMLPGNVAPEAATLDVPLFLGIGERDMVGPTHAVPAAFPNCRDLVLHILPETGHSHFLFPARSALFDRLAVWGRGL